MTKKTMMSIDVETTMNNVDDVKASESTPFHKKNRVVYFGLNDVGMGVTEAFEVRDLRQHTVNMCPNGYEIDTVIGHNFKFDMHYMRKQGFGARVYTKEHSEVDVPFHHVLQLDLCNVWDTQIAEYLLSGMTHHFPSLNECCVKRGLPVKDEKITEYFKKGIGADKIPEEEIVPYLKHDVEVTSKVALQQMQEAQERGMVPLMKTQMGFMLATQEMEYNGMKINEVRLDALRLDYSTALDKIEADLLELIYDQYPALRSINPPLNVGSSKQMAAVIYGGEVDNKVDVPKLHPDGSWQRYKTGDKKGVVKTRKENVPVKVDGIFNMYRNEDLVGANGVHSVSESVLKDTYDVAWEDSAFHTPSQYNILKSLLEYRRVQKELKTYIYGIRDSMYPDGLIHGTIHQTSTNTGRGSSSNPNLQNFPSNDESQLKKVFVSRFNNGRIIEADYKQLEVIALAFLSQDSQMYDDILNGNDIHYETGKKVFGNNMTKDQRRIVKGINFGLIYGGGVNRLAKESRQPKDLVKRIVDAFFQRYPQVKVWQDKVYKEVTESREPSDRRTANGMPAGKGVYKSITGREYVFFEQDNPFTKGVSFSPTQTKNYPVQGFATADIVPMMCWEVMKALKKEALGDGCLMVNTIHDSIIFDCRPTHLKRATRVIKETMERAPEFLKKYFGIDFDLPLVAELTDGENWKDQVEVDF